MEVKTFFFYGDHQDVGKKSERRNQSPFFLENINFWKVLPWPLNLNIHHCLWHAFFWILDIKFC